MTNKGRCVASVTVLDIIAITTPGSRFGMTRLVLWNVCKMSRLSKNPFGTVSTILLRTKPALTRHQHRLPTRLMVVPLRRPMIFPHLQL